MTDQTPPDYKATVFLPQTDFPMKAGLAQKEPAIAAQWAADDLYGKLRAARAGREKFILHDGPPYANGDIHMGHAMNKVLKDIIVRSQTLLGKDAPYVPGWDCHGLPIEWKIEEEYRKKKLNKDEVPPQEFRAQCRAYADKWVDVQKEQFKRLGILGDWNDPYLTMKYEAEAAIVGELLKFAESGQLYRGAKPVMWSPVEKTALAEAEVEYEDVTSTQIDVAFEILDAPNAPELVGAYAVIWTTTPWTIPTNQGIAYGEEIEYSIGMLYDGEVGAIRPGHPMPLARERGLHIIATALIEDFEERTEKSFHVRGTVSGKALAEATARHPMHHLGGFYAEPRPFMSGDFVTAEAGTGLVHMAPDHGEDDFDLCKKFAPTLGTKLLPLAPVFAVQGDGRYRDDWPWLGGHEWSVINKKLLAPDGPICAALSEVGALLSAKNDESTSHSYPHSWRSKAPLIYRCTPQWFIPMDRGETTLRETAIAAIAETRWVPERAANRIGAMVRDRPDWVISRQRAWGVPIALYVHRQTGEYLNDPAVNARIVAAFETGGADAWFGADHQALLGPDYQLADYEVVNDILDVWFDSGSTHAFVVEKRWPGAQADLYLEGSDQHRGWFQSSLLESCGTRGHAPYKAVLTHGFALDGQGRKMSKSLGNVVDPLKVMSESGADILRMWVASTDYFDDVKVGKEVLAGASDAYRKLRNTFRYMLGALEGFSEAERVAVADMPELERYMLHRLAELDVELKGVVDSRGPLGGDSESWLEFGRYTRALNDFANSDLSAFFFDIRKDCLYCDVNPASGAQTEKRKAYRTVLDTLFHALVRYAAPIIPFTAEEVWKSRFPDADSVHLEEWPDFAALLSGHPRAGGNDEFVDEALGEKWSRLRMFRSDINEEIEPLRRGKFIRSSLEAEIFVDPYELNDRDLLQASDLTELTIVASSKVVDEAATDYIPGKATKSRIQVAATTHHKCGRCWRHLPEVSVDGELCDRCEDVLAL